jgi:hypothetical protein
MIIYHFVLALLRHDNVVIAFGPELRVSLPFFRILRFVKRSPFSDIDDML